MSSDAASAAGGRVYVACERRRIQARRVLVSPCVLKSKSVGLEGKGSWGAQNRASLAANLRFEGVVAENIGPLVGAPPSKPVKCSPSNQARVRAHYIPSNAQLTLSEAPQIAHSSHTVTAHTVTSTHSGKYTSRVVALAFAARASPPPCLATIRARSRRCSITFSWPDVGAPRSLS